MISKTLAKDTTTQRQGSADRDLPPHAPGRSADAGVARARCSTACSSTPSATTSRASAASSSTSSSTPRCRSTRRRCRRTTSIRVIGTSCGCTEDVGARRRHRPPRQPPRARGGRAAREPVPHRPGAHGARDQGEDVGPPGHRLGDAARPDQLQAGDRGDPGVLRLVAALAVHGPDQPAGRGHPQAPPLGARTGRPVARARRLRGARRALHALRPHLPDRDAGRPEHRPDLVARRPTPGSTSSASSRPRTRRSRTAACSTTSGSSRSATASSSSARSSPRDELEASNARLQKAGKRPIDGRAARLLPHGLGGGEVHHRAGQRAHRRAGHLQSTTG